MEQKIGRLIEEQPLVVILGLDDQFHRFFPDLLRYLIDSLAKKSGHITVFGIRLLAPLRDDLLQ